MSIGTLTSLRARPSTVALVSVLIALTAGCGGSGEEDRGLAIAFDGTRCDVEGPDRVPAGDVEVSFANGSDGPVGLAFLSFPGGMEVDPGVGADGPITSPVPGGGVEVVGVIELAAGEDADELAALAPGTHVLDCVTFGPNGPEHFWRGAIVDVER